MAASAVSQACFVRIFVADVADERIVAVFVEVGIEVGQHLIERATNRCS